MLSVFISSVCNELSNARSSIRDQIGKNHRIYLSEQAVAEGSPRDSVRAQLKKSDVVICIFGQRMGHIPDTDNPHKLGVTCLEMLWAGDLDIPVYCLVQKAAGRDPDLAQFLNHIGHFSLGKWLRSFSDPIELPCIVDQCVDHYRQTEHVELDFDHVDWDCVSEFMHLLRARLEKEQFEYNTSSRSYIRQTGSLLARPAIDGAPPLMTPATIAVTTDRNSQDTLVSGFIAPEFRRPRKVLNVLARLQSSYNPELSTSLSRTARITDITRFLLRTNRVTVLKGEPGSGKTTALRYIAINLLAAAQNNPSAAPLIPLFFRLNRYRSLQWADNPRLSRPGRLQAFMWGEIRELCGKIADEQFFNRLRNSLRALERRGRILFLFDAIDELPWHDSAIRQKVLRHRANDMIRANNRVIFSCRAAHYDRGFRAQELLIAPFDRDRVRRFVLAHLDEQLRNFAPALVQELLNPAREIRSLCQNPFYLQLFVLFLNMANDYHAQLNSLLRGNNLAHVFRSVMRYKFERARQRPESLSTGDEEVFGRVLGHLAVVMFRGAVHDIEACLKKLMDDYSETAVGRVLESAVEERLLVFDDSGRLTFHHRRLQEYFAALEMAATRVSPDLALDRPADSVDLEEITVLYAAMISDPSDFIDRLLGAPPPVDSRQFLIQRHRTRLDLLAARCIGAVPGRRVRQLPEIRSRLLEQLERGEALQKIEAIRGLRCVMREQEFGPMIAARTDDSAWVQEAIISQLQTTTLAWRHRALALVTAFRRIASVLTLSQIIAKNIPFLRCAVSRTVVALGVLFLSLRLIQLGIWLAPSYLMIWAHRKVLPETNQWAYILAAALVFVSVSVILLLRTSRKAATAAMYSGFLSTLVTVFLVQSYTPVQRDPRFRAVYCQGSAVAQLLCSDVFGNSGGNYVGCLAGQERVRNNLDKNPGIALSASRKILISDTSIIFPDSNACREWMGSWPAASDTEAPSCEYTVSSRAGRYATIEEAITAVPEFSTIVLLDSLYVGAGNRDIDLSSKNVTIRSVSGRPEKCVIDCSGSERDPHRAFIFRDDINDSTQLTGVTIRNGYVVGAGDTGVGGGIVVRGAARPRLENIVFENNRASWGGGGLHIERLTSASVRGLSFVDSRSDSNGGAVYVGPGSSGTLRNLMIVGNRCHGLALGSRSSVTIAHSVIAFNPHAPGLVDDNSLKLYELLIGLVLAGLPILVAPLLIFVQTARGRDGPRRTVPTYPALRTRLADQPISAVGPIVGANLIVIIGFLVNRVPAGRWAIPALAAVCLIALIVWIMMRVLQYRREFEQLMTRVCRSPDSVVACELVTYIESNVPGVYKSRGAQLLSRIEQPTPAFIEAIGDLGGNLNLARHVRDEVWKSAEEIERRFWHQYYRHRGAIL